MIASWALSPLALSLDLLLGERLSVVHPVVLVGRWGRFLEPFFMRIFPRGKWQKVGGVFFLFWVILPPVCFAIVVTGSFLPPFWGNLISIYLAYSLLAARSLYEHVRDVAKALEMEDLGEARVLLGRIVGRDTQALNGSEISRAALESLSENLTDAVVAPLFFLFFGGIPLLVLYKVVSTMDSQVGYKNDLYRDFGWASARFDDLLAFVPARLTLVLCMAFALLDRSGRSRLKESFRLMLAERHFHPSPNSGHGISGYSSLLCVRLGGGAFYQGRWVEKPAIGKGFQHPDTESLLLGLALYRKQIAFIMGSLIFFFAFRWVVLGDRSWIS
ncbi:MAG: adenosylcobinamide-phosphate synthase CbiB [Leptospirillum sp.]|jgi:adenosylcobinamide-phosphate synthase